MTVRNIEMEYKVGKQDQETTDMYAGDIVVVHFKTAGREMADGGNGGQIAIAAHEGPSATRTAVLSLTPDPEDWVNPFYGPQTATTIYCNFSNKEKYGAVLRPLTDYYWKVKIVTGPDANCHAIINLSGR